VPMCTARHMGIDLSNQKSGQPSATDLVFHFSRLFNETPRLRTNEQNQNVLTAEEIRVPACSDASEVCRVVAVTAESNVANVDTRKSCSSSRFNSCFAMRCPVLDNQLCVQDGTSTAYHIC
jgi:hypothetical protein